MKKHMWIAFSLMASVLWGLTCVLDEEVYKDISIFTSLARASLVVFIITTSAAYMDGALAHDLWAVGASKRNIVLVATATLTFVAAELFIGINAKNATLAGLIEISYPIFIAPFAALFFKGTALNLMTAVGGSLILAGAAFIVSFGR
jgi:drug/metabolite transporter (DMT)-like permease